MGSIAPFNSLMQQDDRNGNNGDHQSDNIIFIHKTLCMCIGIPGFAICIEKCNPPASNNLQNPCTFSGILNYLINFK